MKVIAVSHIVVAVPEFMEKCLNKRNPLDISALKLIVYDEADEIFLQENNHKFIAKLNSHLLEKQITPQNLLYSATYDDIQI
jgi:superfamily II DNA/RNA helicase